MGTGRKLKLYTLPDNITAEQKGYIAAFLDGEGYISNLRGKPRKPQPHISLANTNKESIDFIYNILKAGHIYKVETAQYSYSKNTKPCYRLTITAKNEVKAILLFLRPLLIVKRAKAEDALLQLSEV